MKYKIYFLYLTTFIYSSASDSEIAKAKYRASLLDKEATSSHEVAMFCATATCMASVAICCPNITGVLEELPEVTPACINCGCLISSFGTLYYWFRSSVLSTRSEKLHAIIEDARRLDRSVEIRDGLVRRNLENVEHDFDIIG